MGLKILDIIRKRGFKDTIQILSKRKNFKMNLNSFYDELNKFSYYNSFLRVKDVMLELDIISIQRGKSDKLEISLTEKGITLLKKIEELNEIFLKGKG